VQLARHWAERAKLRFARRWERAGCALPAMLTESIVLSLAGGRARTATGVLGIDLLKTFVQGGGNQFNTKIPRAEESG